MTQSTSRSNCRYEFRSFKRTLELRDGQRTDLFQVFTFYLKYILIELKLVFQEVAIL